MDLLSRSYSGQTAASVIAPRLMDKALSGDEPMVIEFSTSSSSSSHGAASGSSVTDDELIVPRAGHKRARINSASVHNDVVKQSCVKRPVTFYGNIHSLSLSLSHTLPTYSQGRKTLFLKHHPVGFIGFWVKLVFLKKNILMGFGVFMRFKLSE